MDRQNSDYSDSGAVSPEDYQHMNEREKDAAIERSIIQLQNKIRNILYLSEMEKKREKERDKEKQTSSKKNNREHSE